MTIVCRALDPGISPSGGSSQVVDRYRSILVVEDPLICNLIRCILSTTGYSVWEKSASRAADVLRSQSADVALLITNMPGSFLEFAQTVPLIYVAAAPRPELAAGFRCWAALQKPFSPQQLLSLVGRLARPL